MNDDVDFYPKTKISKKQCKNYLRWKNQECHIKNDDKIDQETEFDDFVFSVPNLGGISLETVTYFFTYGGSNFTDLDNFFFGAQLNMVRLREKQNFSKQCPATMCNFEYNEIRGEMFDPSSQLLGAWEFWDVLLKKS